MRHLTYLSAPKPRVIAIGEAQQARSPSRPFKRMATARWH